MFMEEGAMLVEGIFDQKAPRSPVLSMDFALWVLPIFVRHSMYWEFLRELYARVEVVPVSTEWRKTFNLLTPFSECYWGDSESSTELLLWFSDRRIILDDKE